MRICSTPKELDPAQYGISATAVHSLDGVLHVGPDRLQTGDLIALLEDLYCGPVAAEFLHLQVSISPTARFVTHFKTTCNYFLKEEDTREEPADQD